MNASAVRRRDSSFALCVLGFGWRESFSLLLFILRYYKVHGSAILCYPPPRSRPALAFFYRSTLPWRLAIRRTRRSGKRGAPRWSTQELRATDRPWTRGTHWSAAPPRHGAEGELLCVCVRSNIQGYHGSVGNLPRPLTMLMVVPVTLVCLPW